MMKSRTRADSQLSSMAGEFLTAGKLFKRGYQVSVTMGNAKAIDLFVHNPKTDRTFTIQVKTLRQKNCFPIRKETIKPGHVYIFVILNPKSPSEDYFILWGKTILKDVNKFFGTSYTSPKGKKVPSMQSATAP